MPVGLTYGLLGPLLVADDTAAIPVRSAKQRALLAALLVDAGQVVPVDELMRRLWGHEAPSGARNTLQNHMLRLRRTLSGPAAAFSEVITHPEGYLIAPSEQALDLHRFRGLVEHAKAALARDDLRSASTALESVQRLWRGKPLSDVPSDVLHREIVPVLAEQRTAALGLRIDVDLRLGRHEELLAELRDLTVRHPLHERFWVQRMVALYRSGRVAEALECYGTVSTILADELGLDPGPDLRRTHRSILTNDPALAAPAPQGCTPLAAAMPRRDLPAEVSGFVGRAEETRQILNARRAVEADDGSQVVVVAIDGMPGAGKTALAVHVAYQVADRYPDAHLYIDLHGQARDRAPVKPAEALGTLLDAIGTPEDQIPGSLEERGTLWRARLAGRRILLLLDNAESAAQIRALLPAAPGSFVLVTSRRRLTDLDATSVVSVGPLPPDEARAMFVKMVNLVGLSGAHRHVLDVLRLCGHLPLAIRVAGARLRSRPGWTVEHLAYRLGDRRGRLGELVVGDLSVADTLSTSFRRLNAFQQDLFCLLGATFEGRFDAAAVALAANLSLPDSERALEDLVDANLLQDAGPGLYCLHDLYRCYVLSLGQRVTRPSARQPSRTTLDRLEGQGRRLTRRMLRVGTPQPGGEMR
jgi:DNA-binding SARP family transcriptional activator